MNTMKKGFTLIEVIVAIALIGILAVSFLPTITFGFTNLFKSQKFSKDIFDSQKEIETMIEEKKNATIDGTDSIDLFGVQVKGYNISTPISTYGEMNFFQPNFIKEYNTPELVAQGHSGIPNIVLLNKNKTTTPSNLVKLFNDDDSLNDVIFNADGNKYKIKDEHKNIHLVNVYRWYTSSEVSYTEGTIPDTVLDNNLLIKEWNAARGLVSYAESKLSNFIPNIQNDPITNQPTYNKFTFNEVKEGLSLLNEDLINNYGNRYLYYSVTPYAVSGKIGKEYYSNAMYVSAPKIEIESAKYTIGGDTVIIMFKDSIKDPFVPDKMIFNESLGDIISITINPYNDKEMSIHFNRAINSGIDIEGNLLYKGSVSSKKYGAISIWTNNKPNDTFTITPIS